MRYWTGLAGNARPTTTAGGSHMARNFMRAGILVLAAATVLGATACSKDSASPATPTSSSAVSSAQSATTAAPPSSVATSVNGPGDQVDGDALESKLLTSNQIVPAYAKKDVTAQAVYAELQKVAQTSTVTPPGCTGVSAITAASVRAGRIATFVDSATRESLTEFLAPAGVPSLADLRSLATQCATANLQVPDKGVSTTATIEIIDTPAVAADATLGLRSTIVTTTAGSPAITNRQVGYLAEAKGTLISFSATGGPSGNPVDQALVDATFKAAVDNVNAG